MDDWLVMFVDVLLYDHWLMMLMDNVLMVLVDYILVVLNDNIFVMFMDNILVDLLNDGSIDMGLNLSGELMLLNNLAFIGLLEYCLLLMGDHNWLFVDLLYYNVASDVNASNQVGISVSY